MKHLLRIPTVEPYGYVEAEYEGTAEDAISEQKRLTKLMKGVEGLSTKEFNEVLDIYITTRQIPNGADLYASMNEEQQMIIQTIKRSHARTKQD